MTDSSYTALLIVLDRSGSMDSIRDDMVGGLDELLRTHATEPGLLTVDVITFDDQIEVTHHFAQANDVHIELVPRGMTALHDAMGFAINNFGAELGVLPEHARPGNVQVIVVTDGQENASVEYTAESVRGLVTRQTEQYNWDFLFLGADQDAVLTASELGIDADKSLTFGRKTENLRAMSGALTSKLHSVRAGKRDHSFTAEERDAATRNDESSESSPSHSLPIPEPVAPIGQIAVKSALISVTEIVNRYGVARKTVQRWIDAGKIVPVKTLTGRTGAHLLDADEAEAAFGIWRRYGPPKD